MKTNFKYFVKIVIKFQIFSFMISGENVRAEWDLCLLPWKSTWRRKILANLIQANHLIREEVPEPRLVDTRAGSYLYRLELLLRPPHLTASSAGGDDDETWRTTSADGEAVGDLQRLQRP
jgi:hypothetical protein